MKPVVIFGASQIAEVVHFYLTNDSPRQVAAFTVDGEYLREPRFLALPVVPFEALEKEFPPSEFDLFIAVSYQKINRTRAEKFEHASAKGYGFATYVSSKSSVWPGLRVGRNTFIMEDNTVQPFVSIGDNVIMWAGNHVGHHSRIGNHCFIASHAVISGNVNVGDYSFVGVNATIRDGVSIGRHCVVGAGTLILGDTKDSEVYMGEPTPPSRVPSQRLRGL